MADDGIWKPLESAPKDGTHILAWRHDWDEPLAVRWYPGRGGFWGLAGVNLDLGDWAQPTHWAPMPAPPDIGLVDRLKLVARDMLEYGKG